MTDNDIIKALEEWSERGMTFCNVGMSEFARNILGLINRQKAKIKALQMDNAQLQSDIINATQNNDHIKALYEEEKQKVEKAKQKVIDYCKMLKTAKSEARKELAERIKEKCGVIDGYTIVDSLLKELEGGNDEENT